MKKIVFRIENVKRVEEFLGATLYSYYRIGTSEATFKFPVKDGESSYNAKELKLTDGDILFKNSNGDLLKKVN